MKNLLRTYRKKTEMTIEDISRLINMPDGSYLSRCEKGLRRPNLEILFTYHLLFQVSIEKLFEKEMKLALKKITGNIEPLIADLSKHKTTKKNKARISFLNSLKALIDKKI